MRRRAFFLAILIGLSAHGPARALDEERRADADQLIAAYWRRLASEGNERPGLSVAIGVNGELLVARGYGEAQPGLAADENTVYHIGSLSKQFTAAEVLLLIDRGATLSASGIRLGLDTAAPEIFSGVEHWRQEDSVVTVRRLLTMTSNLPNFTRRPPSGVDPWGAIPAPTLLGELKKTAPRGWPDSFEYSNTSYFLLAEAVDALAGGGDGTFRDRLRADLFSKAGLTTTGFIGDYPPGSVLAAPHYRRTPAFIKPNWLKGSGDMASSAADLFRWSKTLMEGRILSPAMLDLMLSDAARVDPLTWYGMGWFVTHRDGSDIYFHSGTVPGYTSQMLIMRDARSARWVSVVLLSNSDGIEGLDQLADDIASAIIDAPAR